MLFNFIPTLLHKLFDMLFQVRNQLSGILMIVVASVYSNEIDSFLLAPLVYETILLLLVYEKTIVLRFSGIYLIPVQTTVQFM